MVGVFFFFNSADVLDFSEDGLRVLARAPRRLPQGKPSEKNPDTFRRIFSAPKKVIPHIVLLHASHTGTSMWMNIECWHIFLLTASEGSVFKLGQNANVSKTRLSTLI